MKLKAFLTSLDEVDEKFHELYVADGDGFKLDVEGIQAHPEVTAVATALTRTKATLTQVRRDLASAQEQARQLPDDFDPDLYERAVAEGVGGGNGNGNEAEIRREASEAGKAAAKREAQREIDTLTGERDRLKARVERDTRNLALDAALDSAKVTSPALRAGARALLASQIVIHENEGEYEALANDDVLGEIPVADFVKTWAATDQGKAFVTAADTAGSGANGDGTGGTASNSTTNPWKKGPGENFTEQARIRRENPGLAQKLAKDAGVTLPS